MNKTQNTITVLTIVFLLGLIIFSMWGCPRYSVYKQQKDGEAMLAHAQASREIAVAEAKAKMESATLLAASDTLRAHGVARANEIIGTSLKNNEAYLKYLWIDKIDGKSTIIYVPTETNLPILEANRLGQSQKTSGE